MVKLDSHGSNDSIIRLQDLGKEYQRGSETINVFSGLDLDIGQGEFVAFMGPSGSGKTTLLNLIGGLDVPTSGEVIVGGQELSRMSGRKLASWRAQHIGFVFQLFNLIPVLTAFQNVELPLLLTRLSKKQRREQVEIAMALVGLSDRLKHYPRQLSGGQEQRVAIARAIVTDPTLLLCDEITGDLDRESSNEILDIVEKLSSEQNKTVLIVSHDPEAANRAKTVLHLDKGTLMEAGKRSDVS